MKKLALNLIAIAAVSLPPSVHAAEITVLSGAVVKPGLEAASAAFEKETRHTVSITFNSAPRIVKRVDAGDVFDVVIAPSAAMKQFAAAGKVEAGGVEVGRVGVGVFVRAGAPVPDISSSEALKRTLLAAESVVFNLNSTGIYVENMLKKMGIYEQIDPKTTRIPAGASTMERGLKGKGREVGFGAITEILPYKDKGLQLVGPLPADIQNYTAYVAAPMSAGANRELAHAFVRFLGGPVGKPLFVAAGID